MEMNGLPKQAWEEVCSYNISRGAIDCIRKCQFGYEIFTNTLIQAVDDLSKKEKKTFILKPVRVIRTRTGYKKNLQQGMEE